MIKKLILVNNFKRMGPFKFIPLFFDRISAVDNDSPESVFYTPVFVLVPVDFFIDIANPP